MKNKDIPVGTMVRLSKDSKWAGDGKVNPLNIDGEVIREDWVDDGTDWIKVRWGNGRLNAYPPEDSDLEIIELIDYVDSNLNYTKDCQKLFEVSIDYMKEVPLHLSDETDAVSVSKELSSFVVKFVSDVNYHAEKIVEKYNKKFGSNIVVTDNLLEILIGDAVSRANLKRIRLRIDMRKRGGRE